MKLETGFPGRPTNQAFSSPRMTWTESQGLTGLDGDLPHIETAFRLHRRLDVVSSPTERKPPLVTIRSLPSAARRKASRVASRVSGTMPRSRTSQPMPSSRPAGAKRLEL